jgi:hypothetical protein
MATKGRQRTAASSRTNNFMIYPSLILVGIEWVRIKKFW